MLYNIVFRSTKTQTTYVPSLLNALCSKGPYDKSQQMCKVQKMSKLVGLPNNNNDKDTSLPDNLYVFHTLQTRNVYCTGPW